jgi:predicted amidophosphoribosyltransferase
VHPQRRRERGFDQAEELARYMGSLLGMPVIGCLERRQHTEAMHTLGHEDRAENVSRAFTVRPDAQATLRHRWPVLVDDIVTTGATLAGCARALSGAGAVAVSAVAVAKDR